MVCTDKIYDEIDLLAFSTDDIYGVAKISGEEGELVDIYRPLVEEVVV